MKELFCAQCETMPVVVKREAPSFERSVRCECRDVGFGCLGSESYDLPDPWVERER